MSIYINQQETLNKTIELLFGESKLSAQPVAGKHYKILVIGQTGAGKSTFLNMVCNYFRGGNLDNTPESVKVLIPNIQYPQGTEPESIHYMERHILNAAAENQTNSISEYSFQDGNSGDIFTFVETPGLSDPRGTEQDQVNIQLIRGHAVRMGSISAVILVVNGRAPNLNSTELNTLLRLQGNLLASARQNLIVVASNSATPSFASFNFRALPIMPKSIAFMDNGAFSKHPRNWSKRDQCDHKMNWRASMDVIQQILVTIRSFQANGNAEDWVILNDGRSFAKSKSHQVMLKMQGLLQVQEVIEEFEKQPQQSSQAFKSFMRSNTVTRKELIDSTYYNTICSTCNVVCHDHCSLNEISNHCKNPFDRCWAFGGANCRRCNQNCSYMSHYHDKKTVREVIETVEEVLQDLQRKYLSADIIDEAKIIPKTEQTNTSEDAKRILQEAIGDLIEEMERTCLGIGNACKHFNLMEELESRIAFLETQAKQFTSVEAKKTVDTFISSVINILDFLQTKKMASPDSSSELLEGVEIIQDRESYLNDFINEQVDHDDSSEEEREKEDAEESEGENNDAVAESVSENEETATDSKFLKLKAFMGEEDAFVLQKIDFPSERSLLNYVQNALKNGDTSTTRNELADELTHTFAEQQLTTLEAKILINAVRAFLFDEKQKALKKEVKAAASVAKTCKYFKASGRCKFGNKCRFSHDFPSSSPPPPLSHSQPKPLPATTAVAAAALRQGKDLSGNTMEKETVSNKIGLDVASLFPSYGKPSPLSPILPTPISPAQKETTASAAPIKVPAVEIIPPPVSTGTHPPPAAKTTIITPTAVDTEVRLQISPVISAFLLNHSASHIKALQDICRVHIDQRICVMTFKGPANLVKQALLSYAERLRQGPMTISHHITKDVALEMSCPHERVGWVIGKSGCNTNKFWTRGRVKLEILEASNHRLAFHRLELQGKIERVAIAQEWVALMIKGENFNVASTRGIANYHEEEGDYDEDDDLEDDLEDAQAKPTVTKATNAFPPQQQTMSGKGPGIVERGRGRGYPGRGDFTSGGRGGRGYPLGNPGKLPASDGTIDKGGKSDSNTPVIATAVPIDDEMLSHLSLTATSSIPTTKKAVKTPFPAPAPVPAAATTTAHPFEPILAALGGESEFATQYREKIEIAGFRNFQELADFLMDYMEDGRDAMQNSLKANLGFNLKQSRDLAKAVKEALKK